MSLKSLLVPLLAVAIPLTACVRDQGTSTAPDQESELGVRAADPGIAPPGSTPSGRSYGQWAGACPIN